MSDTMIRLPEPIEVRGEKFHVSVDSQGRFSAEGVKGRVYSSDTLEGLRKALMAVTKVKQAKVSIPATMIHGNGRIQQVTIRGIHAGHGDLLVTHEDGTKDNTRDFYGDFVIPALTQPQIDRLRLLSQAKQQAATAYDEAVREAGARRKYAVLSDVKRMIDEGVS